MRRTALPRHKAPEPPFAWGEAEYAALHTSAIDTLDDRVSEDIFDIEDERAEVELVVHGMIRNEN